MKLKEWRLTHEKTLNECAVLFGIRNLRTYQRYETGENRADADLVDTIVRITGGSVTAADMHEQRLAWLRENHPEKFPQDADRVSTAGPDGGPIQSGPAFSMEISK